MENKAQDIEQTNYARNPATFDYLIARLSDKDLQVRKSTVIALGEMGDTKAIEPLIFSLSRELTRDAGSYPVITEIVEAISKIPDTRALNVFMKIESQMIDRDSPRCPVGLPVGVITYTDTVDGLIRRAVPRELHVKVLDVMRRMSNKLNDRAEQITTRYYEYQQEVIQAEIDRIMPDMADLLQNDKSNVHSESHGIRPDNGNGSTAEEEPPAADTPADVDFDAIRREVEREISDYIRDNDKILTLIRQGQYIKSHISHKKEEKAGSRAIITNIDKMRARAD
jgi:hypothetical protein